MSTSPHCRPSNRRSPHSRSMVQLTHVLHALRLLFLLVPLPFPPPLPRALSSGSLLMFPFTGQFSECTVDLTLPLGPFSQQSLSLLSSSFAQQKPTLRTPTCTDKLSVCFSHMFVRKRLWKRLTSWWFFKSFYIEKYFCPVEV